MSTGTLYVEELRATMRGRFALIGSGVVLFAVGCVATVGTQDTWLDGYGIIAYFLVPLAFVPFSAVFLASPRANRFVESVFTAPVERRDWLTAKILVLVTMAAAYYVALVPMVLVYTHHVGVPLLLQKLLIWAPCLLLVSIAIGTLIGVMFIGESIAAPAATGMGVLLVYGGFVPLQELLVAQGNGATRTGHLRRTTQERLRVHAGRRKHSRHHHADMDQSGDRGHRRVRARRVGLSSDARRGDVGSRPQPTVDHRARDRRNHRAAGGDGGHQL